MSVVACKVYKDKIEIASDSITIYGSTQSKDSAKLFQCNDMTIGGVGLAEETALLRLFSATTKPLSATENSILEFLAAFSTWKKSRVEKSGIENFYILIFGNKAYEVYGWHVKEIDTYGAIGAGMNYALSTLYLGHDVEKAVDVATELSIYCEKPIIKYVVERSN